MVFHLAQIPFYSHDENNVIEYACLFLKNLGFTLCGAGIWMSYLKSGLFQSSVFNGCQGWKTGLTKTPRSRRTRCILGLSSGNRDINFQFHPPIMERFCSKLFCKFSSSLMSISCSYEEIGIMLHFNTSSKWILNPLKLFI